MKIRAVERSDADAIVDLWRVIFPEYNDPAKPQRDPRANIERKLAFGDGLFWLATLDARIVGTTMAGYDGHRGWIYSIGVHPAHRKTGIGRALLAHSEAALAQRGCPKINLQVMADNTGAVAFWQATGYARDAVVSLGKRL